ncbi:MAG TPA: phosphatase PAP2 family protein [Burkholderiaceae bacterium]|nr:phosphatase PAP2 family protein [Burkholderiaceae bacterium]
MRRRRDAHLLAALAAAASFGAAAAGGPLGIDHELGYDDSGPWRRRNQFALEYGSVLVVAGIALSEGDGSRLGHTAWQAVDSVALSAVAAQALKVAFSRSRPAQGDDPNAWFQGHGHRSFPSGEVTQIAAAVTPFVLEYGAEHPGVWLLEALPAYDAIARVKAHAHWQTDVLAGFALGTAIGVYAHTRHESLAVIVLPRAVTIGWRRSF